MALRSFFEKRIEKTSIQEGIEAYYENPDQLRNEQEETVTKEEFDFMMGCLGRLSFYGEGAYSQSYTDEVTENDILRFFKESEDKLRTSLKKEEFALPIMEKLTNILRLRYRGDVYVGNDELSPEDQRVFKEKLKSLSPYQMIARVIKDNLNIVSVLLQKEQNIDYGTLRRQSGYLCIPSIIRRTLWKNKGTPIQMNPTAIHQKMFEAVTGDSWPASRLGRDIMPEITPEEKVFNDDVASFFRGNSAVVLQGINFLYHNDNKVAHEDYDSLSVSYYQHAKDTVNSFEADSVEADFFSQGILRAMENPHGRLCGHDEVRAVDALIEIIGENFSQENPLFTAICNRYNLPTNIIARDWEKNYDSSASSKKLINEEIKKRKSFLRRCFYSLLYLGEDIAQEAPSILYQEFGITNFGRYPRGMLEKQYKDRNKRDHSYGIMVYPKDDHNGAFDNVALLSRFQESVIDSYAPQYKYEMRQTESVIESDAVAEKYRQEIQGAMYIRIIESHSLYDFAKRLIFLDKKYAGKDGSNKIAFGVVGGHGTKSALTLDASSAGGRIDVRNFIGKGVRRAGKKFFQSNAPFVIQSCSTGSEGGLAEVFYETVEGNSVVAPKTLVGVGPITFHLVSGQPKLKVEFYKKDASQSEILRSLGNV